MLIGHPRTLQLVEHFGTPTRLRDKDTLKSTRPRTLQVPYKYETVRFGPGSVEAGKIRAKYETLRFGLESVEAGN